MLVLLTWSAQAEAFKFLHESGRCCAQGYSLYRQGDPPRGGENPCDNGEENPADDKSWCPIRLRDSASPAATNSIAKQHDFVRRTTGASPTEGLEAVHCARSGMAAQPDRDCTATIAACHVLYLYLKKLMNLFMLTRDNPPDTLPQKTALISRFFPG